MQRYRYRDPDTLMVSRTQLGLEFRDFSEAVKASVSATDLLILVPAWASTFGVGFADITYLEQVIVRGDVIKGIYATLVAVGTFFWLLRAARKLPGATWRRKDKKWRHQNETDADQKVLGIFAEAELVNKLEPKNPSAGSGSGMGGMDY